MAKTNDISTLTNDQIREEAAKVLAQRAIQRERMKARGKEKRAYVKELLAAAAAKNLLPKPVAQGPKGKQ